MMKAKPILSAIILFVVLSVQAQEASTSYSYTDFHMGHVLLKNGDVLEGSVAFLAWTGNPELEYLTSKKDWTKDLYPLSLVKFKDEEGKITSFDASEVAMAEQDVAGSFIKYMPYKDDFGFNMKYNENGVMVRDVTIQATLIDTKAWGAILKKDPKKLGFKPLSKGEAVYQNNFIRKGSIAFNDNNKTFFFIDQNNDLSYIPNINYAKGITITSGENIGNYPYAYVQGMTTDKSGWIFTNQKDLLKKLQKKKLIKSGEVVLNNGTKRSGQIAFLRAWNAVKSYRVPLGLYYAPAGDGMIEYYKPMDINYVLQVEDGKQVKYVPVEHAQMQIDVLVPFNEYLSSLENKKSKDEIKNLHPGYVVLKNGTKKAGRVAQNKTNFTFVGLDNTLERIYASDVNLDYLVQTINGVDRKFIGMEHGVRAFEGRGFEFVEIVQPGEKFSYYENLDPTHLRKGATKLAKGAIKVAAQAGSATLAVGAAKQTLKKELDGSDKSLGNVVNATASAAYSMEKTLELASGVIEFGEGGIYFKEYVIINNETSEKVIVYDKNIKEQLKRLFSDCGALDEKELKRLADIDKIEEAINRLNLCY